ncbi:hypothetical protein C4D60_Mb08t23590 [Musa balbisiana]|uniref:Fucosyltransferase n=1 Tax=Musa balbisiana TaxID=52838 RepID=A0A4S8K5Z6_MUSBA|nr:hypothetical protein C4D60_Mb08t23590 [Musa balbisiana]
MGMKRSRIGYGKMEMAGDSEAEMESSNSSRNWTPCGVLACMIYLPLLVLLVGAYRKPSFEWLRSVGFTAETGLRSESSSSPVPETVKDKLLGGLLAPGFDESSCLSRYQSVLYRKASPYTPSPYLVDRLRKYEALHKKCGPNTELYNKSIEQLKSGHSTGPSECNYVVWIPYNGFGNRVLTIVSAFLYALLNDKVLLLHVPEDLADLLCEPFPETSWTLPKDFPVEKLESFEVRTPQSYGNMLQSGVIKNDMRFAANLTLPAYVYLHLTHDYSALDKIFFCEDAQQMLRKLPWLLLKSDNYFVPALFLVEEYEEELRRLFPERETVFHHLGRYLLHPTNVVWGYVTRYYQVYLAKAYEMVGIQIRVFQHAPVSFDTMLNQIINCSRKENLLPAVNLEEPGVPAKDAREKAVLVTTLYSGYFDKLRNMYYEHSTATGEVIGVYQPSHEEQQHTDHQNHNIKAWAEINLLSFSDVLVTTACSTFGYVAQGLGGLKPWIIPRPADRNQACRRGTSMEPCFHSPPSYDCKAHKDVDKGAVVRHVRHCEDLDEGLKLFD